jgi:hypothetical protein
LLEEGEAVDEVVVEVDDVTEKVDVSDGEDVDDGDVVGDVVVVRVPAGIAGPRPGAL